MTLTTKGKILLYRLTKPENVTAAKTCAYLVMYKLVGQPLVKTLQWKRLFPLIPTSTPISVPVSTLISMAGLCCTRHAIGGFYCWGIVWCWDCMFLLCPVRINLWSGLRRVRLCMIIAIVGKEAERERSEEQQNECHECCNGHTFARMRVKQRRYQCRSRRPHHLDSCSVG
jgi:hypothetical protein